MFEDLDFMTMIYAALAELGYKEAYQYSTV